MNTHPTDDEIVRALGPWHSSMAGIAKDAEDRVLSAIAILGLPRLTERAGDFHRVLRNLFRSWCDETHDLFRMIEERDGLGLDCMVCNLITGKAFIIRFGRLNLDIVKRNTSRRQTAARRHGKLSSELLFPDMDDPEVNELRQVTLAYTIEDEGTAAGRPRWFMERVWLLVEHFDCVDHLAEVAQFDRPTSITTDTRRAVAAPRADELKAWRKKIRRARNTAS